MAHWLVKTEPNTYSIADLKREKVTPWDGVRNYQARNFLKDMKPGDTVLVYHSVTDPIGVAGLAKVKKPAFPDPSQFNRKSKYYDPASSEEAPRWFCPELEFVREFKEIVPLQSLKGVKGLEKMELLKRGSRLSVQPLTEKEYSIVIGLAG